MKKIYTLFAALFICASANAQRHVNLSISLESPAAGATLTVGQTFTQRFVLRNIGPDALTAADTLYYSDPSNATGQVWLRVGYTKAVNDTIIISKNLTLNNATNGNANYCISALISNGALATSDSATRKCNLVTIAGGSTSVANMTFTENVATEKLNVFPNPATGLVSLDYKAKNNSDVNVRVIDIAGREAMSVNLGKAYVGQSGYKVDITSLNTGIYFVEIRQEGTRAIGRITKQ